MRNALLKSSLYKTEKVLLWIMILIFFIIQIPTVKTSPETTIRVEPYVSTAPVGGIFTINISLTDVQNLYGVEITVRWNASILKVMAVNIRLGVESHRDGVLHEPIFVAKNETVQGKGEYLLGGLSTAPAQSFNGSGNIVRITFRVISIGSCKLDLISKLANKPPPGGVSSPISHNTIGGFFGRHIEISVFPTMATALNNITISGSIIPPQANVEVRILYRHEEETDWHPLITVETDEQGNYLYVWQPQERGKYEVRTTAIIEGVEEESSLVVVNVQAAEQPIWDYIIIIAIILTLIAAAIAIHCKYKKGKKGNRETSKLLLVRFNYNNSICF